MHDLLSRRTHSDFNIQNPRPSLLQISDELTERPCRWSAQGQTAELGIDTGKYLLNRGQGLQSRRRILVLRLGKLPDGHRRFLAAYTKPWLAHASWHAYEELVRFEPIEQLKT